MGVPADVREMRTSGLRRSAGLGARVVCGAAFAWMLGCNAILGIDSHDVAPSTSEPPDAGADGDAGGAVADSGGALDGASPDASCPTECRGTTPVCLGGVCVACRPGTGQCIGETPQTCSQTGQWDTGAPCSGKTPVCAAGRCGSTILTGSIGTLGPRPAGPGSIRLRSDGLELGATVCSASLCVRGAITK